MKYNIGIDLGGTNLVIGLVDENARLIDKDSVPTKKEGQPEELIADMRQLADHILAKNNCSMSDVETIGIGVPGTANKETGIIEFANNLGFNDVPFLSIMQKQFENKKIFFENDGNAAAWGEYLAGAGRGVESMVVVTLGTGVGGGIILNHEIYDGINYAAGELGHMVISVNGIECNCGRRGCFEAYASATALIEQTKEAMNQDPSSKLWTLCDGDMNQVEGKTLFDGVRLSDSTSEKVLKQFTYYLAAGVINIINIFQPELICIGGGLSKAGDLLIKPLMDIIQNESYTRNSKKQTKIVIAELDNDAGLIGAALLRK